MYAIGFCHHIERFCFQAGFIPIIGDIQRFVLAQTVADDLFALVGVVPDIGELVRCLYSSCSLAEDLQRAVMNTALTRVATVVTAHSYVGKITVFIGQN